MMASSTASVPTFEPEVSCPLCSSDPPFSDMHEHKQCPTHSGCLKGKRHGTHSRVTR